jgi:hypothetical protein
MSFGNSENSSGDGKMLEYEKEGGHFSYVSFRIKIKKTNKF